MTSNRIRHMVVFCLKYDKGSAEAEEFLSDGEAILSKIPCVEKFEALTQISHKNDYHYGFSMEFADQAAYDAYNQNPLHIDFVEQRWKTEVTRFLEIDFKLEECCNGKKY